MLPAPNRPMDPSSDQSDMIPIVSPKQALKFPRTIPGVPTSIASRQPIDPSKRIENSECQR